MVYRFIDTRGTFVVENPKRYNLYFPLTDKAGRLLSSISPNLSGDIKRDNGHFLTPPASIEDLRSNLLCRREFFIRTDKELLRLSRPYDDRLECGLLYHKLIKKSKRFDIEILNFIPHDLAVEIMWVRIINKHNQPISITPTSFIPLYGRSEKNLRDHRHVSSLLNRIDLDRYGIYLKPTMVFEERGHQANKSIYFVLGYEENCQAPAGQFPTLDYFYGEGDLISPDAIQGKIKPLKRKLPEFDGKEACAAFRFKERRINPRQEINYFLIMGIEEDELKIKKAFLKLNSPEKIKQSFKQTKEYWQDYLHRLDFDFKERNFNNWLLWVKFQPSLRRLFGCSFLPHFDYGKGGRGWRDIWQDALTLLFTEPQKAREFILNNFKGIRLDGSNATIITQEGHFISDRNRINRVWMDHGIWPYLVSRLYIHQTADLNILLKETTYFKDAQLKRAREFDANFSGDDYLLRAQDHKIYRGSILEHILLENLVQFFNVGRHNITRLENADWNDGLDMASQNGESAAFTFMYAHNLKDICLLLEKLKSQKSTVRVFAELALLLDRIHKPVDYRNYKAKQARLEQYLEKTKGISGKKIEIKIDDLIVDLSAKYRHLADWLSQKEWLKSGFFNGYYDNRSRRVEGAFKGATRMMLVSQVFVMMSGIATPGQIKKIWVSLKKYLEDKKLDGFRLNTNFKGLYPELGRAFGFAYGDKENGAFFNHMVVMLANALYKRGFVKEGFEVINSVYQMATNTRAGIYPMIPEYFNSKGQGLYLYLTGSASWYIYTLIEEILGIKFIFGRLCLEPRLISPNFFAKTIEVKFFWKTRVLRVIFISGKAKNRPYKIREILLGDKKINPRGNQYLIKPGDLKTKTNTLKVYLE